MGADEGLVASGTGVATDDLLDGVGAEARVAGDEGLVASGARVATGGGLGGAPLPKVKSKLKCKYNII